ncbi:MAG: hypothetical protein QG646_4466 [Euryarchaeota archaeon]|jgi:hypothetical protein|nr:hypothetical protein [Euryarchaeota archaeon]
MQDKIVKGIVYYVLQEADKKRWKDIPLHT